MATQKEKAAMLYAVNTLTDKYVGKKNRIINLKDKERCEEVADILIEYLMKVIERDEKNVKNARKWAIENPQKHNELNKKSYKKVKNNK